MPTVEDRVRAKRAEVESQRSAIARKIEELKSLQAKLVALEDQAAMLDALLADSDSTANSGGEKIGPQNDLPTPQFALMSLMQQHPEGLPQPRILEELVGKVSTDSTNPRAILRNTIYNMVKRNQLVRDKVTDIISIPRT